jgi:hypothetical protein
MPATHDRIIEEALSLPANFRLSLIEKLLESLNLQPSSTSAYDPATHENHLA